MYHCSNVWGNTTNKNVRKLQAVQNFAHGRIVSGVAPLLKSLSWLPVKDQLYYRQAISSSLMTVEDSYALANNFNEFYTNVGPTAAKKASALASEHGLI